LALNGGINPTSNITPILSTTSAIDCYFTSTFTEKIPRLSAVRVTTWRKFLEIKMDCVVAFENIQTIVLRDLNIFFRVPTKCDSVKEMLKRITVVV
jgi:hypothetical protein